MPKNEAATCYNILIMMSLLQEHPVFLITLALFVIVTLYLWIGSFIAIARSGYNKQKKIAWIIALILFPPVFLMLLYRHLFRK